MSAFSYLSVCSGIEAASVAWHPLGWRPVAFAEIEKFPSAVLAHHWPDVPNLGDMTKFHDWPDFRINLLVGGTPCQSFSVAGLRKGLTDPRGNLALTYLALVDRYRPYWVVWENVPGVLSSNKGRDFGSFLGGLAELGYGWAYRSLDAQFFHLAQRRERVFVVGCAGGWQRAAEVLFEPACLSGDSPPRREAGKRVAPTIEARATAGGAGWGTDFLTGGGMAADVERMASHDPACTLTAREYKGPLPEADLSTVVAHSLRAEGFDASEDGTGRGTPLIPITFGGQMSTPQWDVDMRQTLQAKNPAAVAFQSSQSGVRLGGTHATLDANNGPRRRNGVVGQTGVRRLTPRECCRLQGFPDDYLDITFNGKPAADGPKYRALGNSMAVPVMSWLARRIEFVTSNL